MSQPKNFILAASSAFGLRLRSLRLTGCCEHARLKLLWLGSKSKLSLQNQIFGRAQ